MNENDFVLTLILIILIGVVIGTIISLLIPVKDDEQEHIDNWGTKEIWP